MPGEQDKVVCHILTKNKTDKKQNKKEGKMLFSGPNPNCKTIQLRGAPTLHDVL